VPHKNLLHDRKYSDFGNYTSIIAILVVFSG